MSLSDIYVIPYLFIAFTLLPEYKQCNKYSNKPLNQRFPILAN